MVKTFFNPDWQDLGILSVYGRWAGVNWLWSLHITLYHMLISVSLPVIIVEMLFPQRRREPWLTAPFLAALSFLLLFVVVACHFRLFAYRPSIPLYMGTAILAGILALVARHLPQSLFAKDERPVRAAHPVFFCFLGIIASLLLVFYCFKYPNPNVPAPVHAGLVLGSLALFLGLLTAMSGRGRAWTVERQLALVLGTTGTFILLTPYWEFFEPGRQDNPRGMTLVGLAAALCLIWLAFRVLRGKKR